MAAMTPEPAEPRPSPPLLEALYGELKRLAASALGKEGPGHTLQTTALVHEAYLRMVGDRAVPKMSRPEFLSFAATTVRRVLQDYAKAKKCLKRGRDWKRIWLQDPNQIAGRRELDFEALDEALNHLHSLSPRAARVVELRFFGGLNMLEIAGVLGVSERTAGQDWQIARAWLSRALADFSRDGEEKFLDENRNRI